MIPWHRRTSTTCSFLPSSPPLVCSHLRLFLANPTAAAAAPPISAFAYPPELWGIIGRGGEGRGGVHLLALACCKPGAPEDHGREGKLRLLMELEETLPVSQLPPAKPEASRPEHLVRQSRKAGKQAGRHALSRAASAGQPLALHASPPLGLLQLVQLLRRAPIHTHTPSLPPSGRAARKVPACLASSLAPVPPTGLGSTAAVPQPPPPPPTAAAYKSQKASCHNARTGLARKRRAGLLGRVVLDCGLALLRPLLPRERLARRTSLRQLTSLHMRLGCKAFYLEVCLFNGGVVFSHSFFFIVL